MATARLNVNPTVLNYYIRASGLSSDQLAKKDQLNKLPEWLAGERKPTFNQLETLAKQLNIPVGYLVLDDLIDDTPGLVDYRTVDSHQKEADLSRNLIDTIHSVQAQQDYLSAYRQDIGFEPLAYVGAASIDDDVDETVDKARELLQIQAFWQDSLKKEEPFKFFRKRLNRIGISVQINGKVAQNTRRPLDLQEFRAFALPDKYAPFIFINGRDSKNGRLFSLLHEFCHIWLGEPSLYNVEPSHYGVSRTEIFCNAFAAELLLPNQLFNQAWPDDAEENEDETMLNIDSLASEFKVSTTLIARKALDHDYISQDMYEKVSKQAKNNHEETQRKQAAKPGGDFWNTLKFTVDPPMLAALLNGYYEDRISYTDAAKLLSISPKNLKQLLVLQ